MLFCEGIVLLNGCMCLSWYFTPANPFLSVHSERLCTNQSILVYRLTSRVGVLRILCSGKFRQMSVREEQILIISKSMAIGQVHIFHVTDYCNSRKQEQGTMMDLAVVVALSRVTALGLEAWLAFNAYTIYLVQWRRLIILAPGSRKMGGSQVQAQPQLYSESEDFLGYMRPRVCDHKEKISVASSLTS